MHQKRNAETWNPENQFLGGQNISERKRSQNDKPSDNKQQGKSRQHCSEYIFATLKAANRSLTYAEFGKNYRYGYLRNVISILIKKGKVASPPKEWPKRFILPEWASRPEYASVQRNDKRGTVGKFDYLSYLEGLGWSSLYQFIT